MAEIPPNLQQQVAELQRIYERLQALSTQRIQLEIEKREAERALTEIQNLDDKTPLYKMVGSLLFKANRKTIIEELTDRIETLDMRIKALKRQEEITKKQFEEKRKEIQDRMQGL